ncbi:MAG: PQQ-dependent sugar dehydrogenase [Chloroflexota bacterium]
MSRRLLSRAIASALTVLLLAAAGPVAAADPTLSAETVQSGLIMPWDVAFAPDGSMLVTERIGRVRVFASGSPGAALRRTVTIPSVRAEGEAGLMGIAVDVDFAANRFVYVCASRDYGGSGGWVNEVLRYTVAADGSWGQSRVLLGGMRAASTHNGCALEMEATGHLWIGMGESNVPALAQNRGSLNGKILRINRDGSVPADNPLIAETRNAVYTMGHRNPQGIAFRPGTSQVFSIEHGPNQNDEVNRLIPGGNYGWPCYTGDGEPHLTDGCGPATAYLPPVWASGASTIATSNGAFVTGSDWADAADDLFVATLKDQDLRRLDVAGDGSTATQIDLLFNGQWGRLRAVVPGPGNHLYVTSSNSNDRVVRIKAATPQLDRLAGFDRYATAAAASAAAFPGGARAVLVATGENFPDALAASAAAGRIDAPLLLVRSTAIPDATATELARLDPDTITIVGGPDVITDAVRDQLMPYAPSVVRLSGADRYATAAAVSGKFSPTSDVPAVMIATGTGFPDALGGAPAAAHLDASLLLTRPNALPPATSAELARLDPATIYVLGGPAAVSDVVLGALDAYADVVVRLGGADRYGTAAEVAQAFWTHADGAWVATGRNFPDALAGSALAGGGGEPLLLVTSGSVPAVTGQELVRLRPSTLHVLGGTTVILPGAEALLRTDIGLP